MPLPSPLLARLGLFLLLAAGAVHAGAAGHAATRTISAAGAQAFPITLWYPVQGAPGTAPAADAPLPPGRHPLVLFSHGSGGSERNQRGWAEQLARAGYIVAVPRHWGDSFDQPEGRGTDVQLVGRPLQAGAALDTLLADPQLGPAIDPARIGMLGFSAGGYTTLVMSGARPDFGRWKRHCEAHAAADKEFCPPAVWRMLPIITQPGRTLPRETRIKAAVVMAPVAVFFDQAGLSGVRIPLRIYAAADDRVVQNQWNAVPLAAALPAPAAVNMVPGGHFVFLEPCTADMLAQFAQLCVDAPGVDRVAIQRRIGAELLDFFGRHL